MPGSESEQNSMMGCHSEGVDATLRPGWIWVSEWSGLSSSRGCVVGMAVWAVWGLGVAAAGPRAAIKAAAPRGGAGAQQGGDVAQLRDEGHALDREHAAALQLPMLVLLHQHRPHQAHDRVVAGDDADNAGAALDHCAAMRTSRCRGWRLEGEVVPAAQKDPEGWSAADTVTVVLERAGLTSVVHAATGRLPAEVTVSLALRFQGWPDDLQIHECWMTKVPEHRLLQLRLLQKRLEPGVPVPAGSAAWLPRHAGRRPAAASGGRSAASPR
jgi:hypothetical protein